MADVLLSSLDSNINYLYHSYCCYCYASTSTAILLLLLTIAIIVATATTDHPSRSNIATILRISLILLSLIDVEDLLRLYY